MHWNLECSVASVQEVQPPPNRVMVLTKIDYGLALGKHSENLDIQHGDSVSQCRPQRSAASLIVRCSKPLM